MGTEIHSATRAETLNGLLPDDLGPHPLAPPPPPNLDALPATPIPEGMLPMRAFGPRDIEPSNVRQGPAIGDCTLHAALASMALTQEGRSALHKMIEPGCITPGAESWSVTLYRQTPVGTLPCKVVVTRADVTQTTARATYLANGTSVVWPLLLECAVCKLNGGATTNMPDTFRVLTGKPARDIDTTQPIFAEKLLADFRAHRVQTLSTTGRLAVDITKPFPLYANHCYTVTNVELKDGEVMVTLRNPHGTEHPPMTAAQARSVMAKYSVGEL